ncbi:MAG: glycosyltransferase family 4 protein [Flavobacteriaceae bacterium]
MSENPLRICHLTYVHNRYDVRIFHKECKSLASAGFDVSFIVADGLPDEIKDGIKIYGVPKEASKIKQILRATKNVYKKAVELNADVYHFHDPPLLPYGNKLKRLGKTVIFDSHEDFPRQIQGRSWVPGIFSGMVAYVLEKYEDYCCRKYDTIISATPYINERFKKVNTSAVNINNYPFLNEFKIESSAQGKKEPNSICYIGGITEIRGLTYVIRALEGTNIKLHLAGGIVPQAFEEKLRSEAGWKNVEYHGHVSREQLREILNVSVAGIVTFLPLPNHVNAQPNKFFEYMSSSIAVIGSNYPLWKAIIEGHNCGLCVDPQDVEAIRKAMEYFVDNPAETEAKGKNGRKAIEEVYNWEQEEKKLVALYESFM